MSSSKESLSPMFNSRLLINTFILQLSINLILKFIKYKKLQFLINLTKKLRNYYFFNFYKNSFF